MLVEQWNTGDEVSLDAPVSDPVGPINRSVLNAIHRNTTHVVHQYPLVAAEAAVVTGVLCKPIQHNAILPRTAPLIILLLIIADHPQRGLELVFPAGSIHVLVLAFKVPFPGASFRK